MTLVQVKRPDRRLDTAEVILTVTREVDAEGVMKAYRGDDAPTREKDLVRRQEDLAAADPAAAGAINARAERRPASGARQRRSSCSGSTPAIPSGDPRQELVAPARRGSNDPRKGVLTVRQYSVGSDRRPSPVRGGSSVAGGGRRQAAQGAGRAPSVPGRGADIVLGLDSADGSVAAHRPTPDVPAHGPTHRRRPLGDRPGHRAARPGLTPLNARKKHVLTCGSQRRQTSRPVRRVLSPGRLAAAGETAIHLGPALLSASCGLPANSGGQPSNVRAGPSCDGPS